MKCKVCLVILLILIAGCQHSNPVNNGQTGNKPKGYNLYFGNWGSDEIFVLDTDSNVVVDTLKGFSSVWDMAVTKSGQKLYVSTREGPVNFPGKVYSVDLFSKEVKRISDKVSDVYTTPDGTIFIISKQPLQLPFRSLIPWIFETQDSIIKA